MKRIFALVLALMMALAIGAYAEGGLDKGGVTNASGLSDYERADYAGCGLVVCVGAGFLADARRV